MLHVRYSGFRDTGRLTIGTIKLFKVSTDAVLQLLDASLQLTLAEVAVGVVHRLEFAAVDRNHCLGEELETPAQ